MIAGAEEREGEGGWLPMGLSEDGCQGLRVLSFSFFQAVRELTETCTFISL